jgi:hypothetical protein
LQRKFVVTFNRLHVALTPNIFGSTSTKLASKVNLIPPEAIHAADTQAKTMPRPGSHLLAGIRPSFTAKNSLAALSLAPTT